MRIWKQKVSQCSRHWKNIPACQCCLWAWWNYTLRFSHTSSFLQTSSRRFSTPPSQGRTPSAASVTPLRFSMDALGFITQRVFHPSFLSESKPPTNLPQSPWWPHAVSAGCLREPALSIGWERQDFWNPEAVSQNTVTSQDIKCGCSGILLTRTLCQTLPHYSNGQLGEKKIIILRQKITEEAESWHCWAWIAATINTSVNSIWIHGKQESCHIWV